MLFPRLTLTMNKPTSLCLLAFLCLSVAQGVALLVGQKLTYITLTTIEKHINNKYQNIYCKTYLFT